MGLIGGQFARTAAQAKALQRELNSIKLQAAVGAGMAAAGFLGLDLLSKTLPDAREYAHQLNIMNMAGLSHVEIAQAVGAAWKNTSTVITTTATDNLKSLLDLRNILGSMKDAQWALPIVSKVGAAMASSKEGRISGNAQDIAFSMAKALDILGKASDPKTFARNAGEMSKVISAFQGRVSPRMFQSVFAYARQAKFGLEENFIYSILPTLMLEYASSGASQGGGSRGVGPALAAFVRWRDQGYVNKKAIPELARLGLINPNSAIRTTTSGTTIGAMKGSGNGNFFDWVQTTLMPAVNRRFGGNATRPQTISEINQIMRGNQLAAQLVLEFALKQKNFIRDAGIIKGAMPYDKAYAQAIKNDPEAQLIALHQQWKNVLTQLGLVVLPSVLSVTKDICGWLNILAIWMKNNQGATKALVWAFAGLSAALMFGGSVLLLAAAFRGLGLVFGVGGLLVPGVKVLTAALGARGLLGALLPLGPAILAIAVAAGIIYAAENRPGLEYDRKKFGKGQKWSDRPDLVKGSFWHQDVNDFFGTTGGLSFAAPKNPRNEWERQEVAAKQRNDHLVDELWSGLKWLGKQFDVTINMDGKQVATVVSKHQAKAANGPVGRSPARFNPVMNPAQP